MTWRQNKLYSKVKFEVLRKVLNTIKDSHNEQNHLRNENMKLKMKLKLSEDKIAELENVLKRGDYYFCKHTDYGDPPPPVAVDNCNNNSSTYPSYYYHNESDGIEERDPPPPSQPSSSMNISNVFRIHKLNLKNKMFPYTKKKVVHSYDSSFVEKKRKLSLYKSLE